MSYNDKDLIRDMVNELRTLVRDIVEDGSSSDWVLDRVRQIIFIASPHNLAHEIAEALEEASSDKLVLGEEGRKIIREKIKERTL